MFDKFLITYDENGTFTSSAHPDGWADGGFSGSFADKAALLKNQLNGYFPSASVDLVSTGSSDFNVECQIAGVKKQIWERSRQNKFDSEDYYAQGMSSARVIYQTIHNGTMAKSCHSWVGVATASAE